MLKLSQDAAKVLNDARSEAAVPDNYGLRIFTEPGAEGSNLAIAFAPGPESGDEVTEQEGLPVFISRDVAVPLDDAVLDVERTDTGVSLIIKMEEDAGDLFGTEDVSDVSKNGHALEN